MRGPYFRAGNNDNITKDLLLVENKVTTSNQPYNVVNEGKYLVSGTAILVYLHTGSDRTYSITAQLRKISDDGITVLETCTASNTATNPNNITYQSVTTVSTKEMHIVDCKAGERLEMDITASSPPGGYQTSRVTLTVYKL